MSKKYEHKGFSIQIVPDGKYEQGREDQPAVSEEGIGVGAGHVVDVGGEAFRPVEPHDGDAFEEGDVHQRDGRTVVIHQLENVNASLRDMVDKSMRYKLAN